MSSGHCRYIFSMGELSRKDFSIRFKNEKGNHYIPIKNTRELYCLNEVSLNSKFLEAMSKAGIIIHFFNYYGNYTGTFFPKEQLLSGKLKIKQAECFINNRLEIAKFFVKGIANNIYHLLYHYYRHGKEEIKPFLDILRKEIPVKINKTKNINQLLSVEGEIWNRFYETFKVILPKEFSMNKRVKRPPDNPINALISFGNTILYTKTIAMIYQTHLDQTISFLHEPSERRFSLSLDLSEIFKPIIVYKVIFNLVNQKKLKVEKHFDKNLNYSLLNENGRKIFITAFEEILNTKFKHSGLNRMVSYQTVIKLEAYKLIKFIMENKPFVAFCMRSKK
jgi:CRISPR-associated protein Cas1